MATAEENAIEIARLQQRLEDHIAAAVGHRHVEALDSRIALMEKTLMQIRYTGFGIAALVLFMATGADLSVILKLIGL